MRRSRDNRFGRDLSANSNMRRARHVFVQYEHHRVHDFARVNRCWMWHRYHPMSYRWRYRALKTSTICVLRNSTYIPRCQSRRKAVPAPCRLGTSLSAAQSGPQSFRGTLKVPFDRVVHMSVHTKHNQVGLATTASPYGGVFLTHTHTHLQLHKKG